MASPGARLRVALLLSLCGSAVISIVVMHTQFGRPLLIRVFGSACPVNRVTPEQVAAAHEEGLSHLRGTSPAPARPAFGLELDRMTEEEARQWASARGFDCSEQSKGMLYLKCHDVPLAALDLPSSSRRFDEVTLAFSPQHKLIAVDTWRKERDAEQAASVFHELTNSLEHRLGSPTSVVGDANPAFLGSGRFHLAATTFRFSNYIASVSATNLAEQGIVVRAQYQSAAPSL